MGLFSLTQSALNPGNVATRRKKEKERETEEEVEKSVCSPPLSTAHFSSSSACLPVMRKCPFLVKATQSIHSKPRNPFKTTTLYRSFSLKTIHQAAKGSDSGQDEASVVVFARDDSDAAATEEEDEFEVDETAAEEQ